MSLLLVFFSLAHSIFILSFSFFFLLRDISSHIKIIHHNFNYHIHAHINHMQLGNFCRACIHFFVLLLVLWYFGFPCLPLILFLLFEICSIPRCVHLMLSFIPFYTLFRSFFWCVRARCLEKYTYITYCIQMNE